MNEKLRRLRKGSLDDWPSLALLEFTVALARAMKARDMKQKDLADALDVSPPYISSVMSGNENLTVEQMSRLAKAVGGTLHLTIAPQGLYVRWIEDALEKAATEAEISPPLHSREATLSTPVPVLTPQLEATSRRPGVEQLTQAPSARTAAPSASRLAQHLPSFVGRRAMPLLARRPVNLLDQSGGTYQ
jgi:transcriptional regulator with XRE-family HTH domain